VGRMPCPRLNMPSISGICRGPMVGRTPSSCMST
jgi:hypothetical protein